MQDTMVIANKAIVGSKETLSSVSHAYYLILLFILNIY